MKRIILFMLLFSIIPIVSAIDVDITIRPFLIPYLPENFPEELTLSDIQCNTRYCSFIVADSTVFEKRLTIPRREIRITLDGVVIRQYTNQEMLALLETRITNYVEGLAIPNWREANRESQNTLINGGRITRR